MGNIFSLNNILNIQTPIEYINNPTNNSIIAFNISNIEEIRNVRFIIEQLNDVHF